MPRILWEAAVIVGLMGLCGAPAQAAVDPPLEVYLHTQTEDGERAIVVIYHANHTFELTTMQAAPAKRTLRSNRFHGTGAWWWSADGRFCFRMDNGNQAGRDQCKSNGNYIGRMPISAAPPGSAGGANTSPPTPR